jgi:hypothetical protein
MKNNSLTLTERVTLGIILNKEIEAKAKLSIAAWERGEREASALFEGQKKEAMAIRNKLGLH